MEIKKFKGLLMVALMAMLVTVISGCSIVMDSTYSIDSSDNITSTVKMGYDEKTMKSLYSDDLSKISSEGYTLETINGKNYYVQSETETVSKSQFDKNAKSIIYTQNSFYSGSASALGTDSSELGSSSSSDVQITVDYLCFTVKLNGNIVNTNGTLVDANTVKWEYTDIDYSNPTAIPSEFYAYTDAATNTLESDQATIKSRDVKKNGVVTEKGIVDDSSNYPLLLVKGSRRGKTFKKKARIFVSFSSDKVIVKRNGKRISTKKLNLSRRPNGKMTTLLKEKGNYYIKVISSTKSHYAVASFKIR